MPAGRPTDYTQELADVICGRLANGESLRSICREEGMPDKTNVFRWLRTHQEFCHQYTKAKEESTDALFEDLLEIADDGSNDWMETNDPDNPGYRFNGEHYQRSRLRLDTRKWALSKLKPKKYGDRTTVEATINDYTNMTSEERRRRLLELQQELQNVERG